MTESLLIIRRTADDPEPLVVQRVLSWHVESDEIVIAHRLVSGKLRTRLETKWHDMTALSEGSPVIVVTRGGGTSANPRPTTRPS